MRPIKSERLKKLEGELHDLEQWLKLGLVPKKDIEKHREEISMIQEKISEEKERLQFLKESGEIEEFVAPKRGGARAGYNEMPTIPDIDMAETGGFTDTGFDIEEDVTYTQHGATNEHEEEEEEKSTVEKEEDEGEEDEESYFSDRNRWKRGGIVDPDADDW